MKTIANNHLPASVLFLSLILITLACHRSWASTSDAESTPQPMIQKPVPLTLPLKDPAIVIYKEKRQLELHADGQVVRTYRIGLGFGPVKDKVREGDGRTPEGEFYVFVKNPRSSYYLSLGISYPNIEHADRGLRDGLISKKQHSKIVEAIRNRKAPPQYTPLGGLIYIHGNGSQSDWTWGCVALENADIKELFDAVDVGTTVRIYP